MPNCEKAAENESPHKNVFILSFPLALLITVKKSFPLPQILQVYRPEERHEGLI